ncbi:IS3-Spn1, transposase [Streptococcus pneumoniae]|nr:IS3-Spn1, transposase [Streptococcus pneumoniae]
MTEFSLVLLLKSIKLARWTYYYHLKQLDKTDKDQELKAEIQSIFIEHKGNYAYRRVHLELRNRAYLVNHKRVQGLIKVLNLQAKMRQKRKYSSHKGDVGKKAENLIQGQFEGSKTMEKCYTDVTEFAIPASTQKLYLSPVLDGFNSEIIAYNLSTSPNLEQVQTMLEQVFTEKHYENTILHSDQGWQYRHDSYHRFLESKGIQASMSRKGDVGKKAENLIQGQFEGSKTMEKCYTDVTEFAIPASTQKLYLSPVLDGFNSEIIAYNLSTSPNLEQVQTMLEQVFTEKHYENTILHSDQGWQYRHDSYHRFLESKGIQASMSRKGNSPDNGMMESFFGILKSEMFYGYEKSFQSLKQLEQAIVDYVDYYNNKRIKVKLKGLSPVQYRTKSFG